MELKTIYLMRHAETAMGGMTDHTRVLTARGTADAHRAAGFLAAATHKPDYIIASTATRTRMTAAIVAAANGLAHISFINELYLAPPDRIITAIQSVPEHVKNLIVIAHNPGLHDLARRWAGQDENLPAFYPASIAHFQTSGSTWAEIDNTRPQLLTLRHP